MRKKITRFRKDTCLINLKGVMISTFVLMFGIGAVKAQDPVVKQYSAADVDALVADMKAGEADVYELTDSGGDYMIVGGANAKNIGLIKHTTIRAAAGLAKKPVISLFWQQTHGNELRIFTVSEPDLTIKFEGLEFNGVNTGIAFDDNFKQYNHQPILIVAEAENCNLIIKDCYIHHFKNIGLSNGTLKFMAEGALLNMQGTLMDNCINRVINYYTGNDAEYGDLILKNNTFSNIGTPDPADQTVLVRYEFNTKTKKVEIDHCTFYNFKSKWNLFYIRSLIDPSPAIVAKNSVFVDVNGTFTNSPERVFDYCFVSGFNGDEPSDANVTNSFPDSPVPVFTDVDMLDFTLTNSESFIAGDGKIAGNTMYYGPINSSHSTMDHAKDFLVYLNNNNQIVIDYRALLNEPLQISIYDIRGQKIVTQRSLNPVSLIPVPHEGGLYVVTISEGNKFVSRKIIVQ